MLGVILYVSIRTHTPGERHYCPAQAERGLRVPCVKLFDTRIDAVLHEREYHADEPMDLWESLPEPDPAKRILGDSEDLPRWPLPGLIDERLIQLYFLFAGTARVPFFYKNISSMAAFPGKF